MKYEVWSTEDEVTLCLAGKFKQSGNEDAILLTSFDAEEYNSAMQKYYDFMGWGKYSPV